MYSDEFYLNILTLANKRIASLFISYLGSTDFQKCTSGVIYQAWGNYAKRFRDCVKRGGATQHTWDSEVYTR